MNKCKRVKKKYHMTGSELSRIDALTICKLYLWHNTYFAKLKVVFIRKYRQRVSQQQHLIYDTLNK